MSNFTAGGGVNVPKVMEKCDIVSNIKVFLIWTRSKTGMKKKKKSKGKRNFNIVWLLGKWKRGKKKGLYEIPTRTVASLGLIVLWYHDNYCKERERRERNF